ncbi:MAG: hypothetical protein AVO35_01480 [Candidatus Aegiribacteria sp. MLS_C]|nr:MAG: hypothetical protein AVO35_01480 [Candidatus Aegiribacteria sp. MLS_C]
MAGTAFGQGRGITEGGTLDRVGGEEALASAIEASDALLLDFDGVLADSEPVFRRAWNHALSPWGHTIGKNDYWNYWSSRGEGLEGEIRRRGISGIDVREAACRQREAYLKAVGNGEVSLFPGAVELLRRLDALAGNTGMGYCIASNTSESIIRDILLGNDAPVPMVVGGDGLPKKPSPDIFLKAASLLGAAPSRSLVAEDSWKGVKAAFTGGFRSILVLNPLNRDLCIESDFTVSGLEGLIRSLPELPSVRI